MLKNYRVWLLVLLFVISLCFWYVQTDRALNFVLLSNGYCGGDEATTGACTVYMVENFSAWHAEDHHRQIREHAMNSVSTDSGISTIFYFKDNRWTKQNQESFGSNTMEEMAAWDRGTNFFLARMPSSFICRVDFRHNESNRLIMVPYVSEQFNY